MLVISLSWFAAAHSGERLKFAALVDVLEPRRKTSDVIFRLSRTMCKPRLIHNVGYHSDHSNRVKILCITTLAILKLSDFLCERWANAAL